MGAVLGAVVLAAVAAVAAVRRDAVVRAPPMCMLCCLPPRQLTVVGNGNPKYAPGILVVVYSHQDVAPGFDGDPEMPSVLGSLTYCAVSSRKCQMPRSMSLSLPFVFCQLHCHCHVGCCSHFAKVPSKAQFFAIVRIPVRLILYIRALILGS